MTIWEYKLEKVFLETGTPIGLQKAPDPHKTLADRLNGLGKDGWELVSVNGPIAPDGCNPLVLAVLYLKRPKS